MKNLYTIQKLSCSIHFRTLTFTDKIQRASYTYRISSVSLLLLCTWIYFYWWFINIHICLNYAVTLFWQNFSCDIITVQNGYDTCLNIWVHDKFHILGVAQFRIYVIQRNCSPNNIPFVYITAYYSHKTR
jgi:hypothetical protein